MGNTCIKPGANDNTMAATTGPAAKGQMMAAAQAEPPPPMPASEKLSEMFEQFVASKVTVLDVSSFYLYIYCRENWDCQRKRLEP